MINIETNKNECTPDYIVKHQQTINASQNETKKESTKKNIEPLFNHFPGLVATSEYIQKNKPSYNKTTKKKE